jgi:hypothetical protein
VVILPYVSASDKTSAEGYIGFYPDGNFPGESTRTTTGVIGAGYYCSEKNKNAIF